MADILRAATARERVLQHLSLRATRERVPQHRPLPRGSLRLLFTLCACVLAGSLMSRPAGAAESLDPQTNRPYDWRIVIACRPHPLLNDSLRNRLVRDVQSALQPTVGERARVTVFDLATLPQAQWEPLWSAFSKQGWKAIDPPGRTEPQTLTGVKTHFLTVTATGRNGRTVRLESRQLDGDTGLLSPVCRVRETTAPETLGRLAGLMLAPDFGLVGTVIETSPKSDWVRLRLRAADLGSPQTLVKRGDVFAVATVLAAIARPADTDPQAESEPQPLRAAPRAYTLLRAAEPPSANGTLKCDVLTQYVTPFPRLPGIVGFRALKLATVAAPVQVRVVDSAGKPPAPNLLIRVRAVESDFGVRPNPRDFLVQHEGVFRSERLFHQLACISVGLGGAQGERRYPVPILGDGVPHVLSYSVSAEEIARAAFERQCEELRGQIAEARTAERSLYESLFKLITDGKNQEAFDRATAGLKRFQESDRRLTKQLDQLKAEPGAKEPLPAALLASSETLLVAMRESLPPLASRITDLKESIARAKDPIRFEKEFRAKEMVAQIRQYLEFGEVPEALALYDALYTLTQQADVKAQREALAKEWQPQGPDHAPARQFLTEKWRAAGTVTEYQQLLPKLKASAEVLRKYNDRHGLRLLLTAMEPVHARLKQMADVLDAGSDVDRPKLQEIQAVVNGMLEVETAAREKLKALTPALSPSPSPS